MNARTMSAASMGAIFCGVRPSFRKPARMTNFRKPVAALKKARRQMARKSRKRGRG